jgi:hypothetical protein
LVEEDAGEQSYEVHFGSDQIISQLGDGEVDDADFLGFLFSLTVCY